MCYQDGATKCEPEKVMCNETVSPKKDYKGDLSLIKGKGRFINRPTRTGGKTYDKFFIYVPTEVARDGTFPFKAGEEVYVKIENGKVVLEKAPK